MKMSRDEWNEITEETFNKIFKNSALKRTGYKGLTRNLNFIKSH
jgi:epoxyqueuosine reductase